MRYYDSEIGVSSRGVCLLCMQVDTTEYKGR